MRKLFCVQGWLPLVILVISLPQVALANNCKLVNLQCSDKTPSKVINGVTFNLADACSKYGLTGEQCCWNATSKYYCGDTTDTCKPYRGNTDCSLVNNTCTDKDYITGHCNKYKSEYSCAGGYADIESRVCTNVVCANNESGTDASGTAKKCFNPKPPAPDNSKNMGNVIAYLQMGQAMAQDMQCDDQNNPLTCRLFAGKYFSCYMYAFQAGQPGTWNNGGADCMVNTQFFSAAGVPRGYDVSDRHLYSQASSGTNNVMGNGLNYSLSGDDKKAINNTVDLQHDAKSPVANQDQNIPYDGNNSRNQRIALENGKVVSVTINKSMVEDLKGLTSFKDYLSDVSVNLAWNRQKAEIDPNNIKNITFSDEGVTRARGGNSFGWNDTPNQPVINGLCVHFADYCEGGEDDATNSVAIKVELGWAGGLTNPNFCAKCVRDPILNTCISGEPRQTLQQWCCFSSKVALDINLAAYDQGLLNIYTGGNRYTDQIHHENNICGGVTVEMISRIDFSRGNYFNDLMSSMDINQLIDTSNFTDGSIQGNTQNRANGTATNIINQWKNKERY